MISMNSPLTPPGNKTEIYMYTCFCLVLKDRFCLFYLSPEIVILSGCSLMYEVSVATSTSFCTKLSSLSPCGNYIISIPTMLRQAPVYAPSSCELSLHFLTKNFSFFQPSSAIFYVIYKEEFRWSLPVISRVQIFFVFIFKAF